MVAHKLAKFGMEMQDDIKTHILIPTFVQEDMKKDFLGVIVLKD